MNDWTQDLHTLWDVARIDQLPEPACLIRSSGDRPVVTVTCLTDPDASRWELALDEVLPAGPDESPLIICGRIRGVMVKIATVEDIFMAHVGSALLGVADQPVPYRLTGEAHS